jgi:hypothetical protein
VQTPDLRVWLQLAKLGDPSASGCLQHLESVVCRGEVNLAKTCFRYGMGKQAPIPCIDSGDLTVWPAVPEQFMEVGSIQQ